MDNLRIWKLSRCPCFTLCFTFCGDGGRESLVGDTSLPKCYFFSAISTILKFAVNTSIFRDRLFVLEEKSVRCPSLRIMVNQSFFQGKKGGVDFLIEIYQIKPVNSSCKSKKSYFSQIMVIFWFALGYQQWKLSRQMSEQRKNQISLSVHVKTVLILETSMGYIPYPQRSTGTRYQRPH